ncbi:MAG: sugar transferase [Salinivirgaceae bacterium]
MIQKSPKIQVAKYVTADYFAALASWVIFFIYRKIVITAPLYTPSSKEIFNSNFYAGIVLIPLFWLLIYYVSGEYHDIYRKSRLQELGKTIFIVTLGVIFIFFLLILDDTIISYKNYYQSFFFLWGVHFILTYLPRVTITTRTNSKIQNHKIGFPTLIIGSNEQAVQLYFDLQRKPKSAGNQIVGYITVNGDNKTALSDYIPYLGKLDTLITTINQQKIEEVIIAIEPSEREKIQQILVKTKATNVLTKAIPDLLDIMAGSVKMSSLFGVPLIELSHELLPAWQENLKRVIDVSFSTIALIILSPLFLVLALWIKFTSKGPILYSHTRMGRYGKPFKIYKFRSMFLNAEQNGPALSSKDDPRVTPFGRFMRKTRLDELPQFYNVLKGDMSLVGPRPEREFFVNQIVQKLRITYYFLK